METDQNLADQFITISENLVSSEPEEIHHTEELIQNINILGTSANLTGLIMPETDDCQPNWVSQPQANGFFAVHSKNMAESFGQAVNDQVTAELLQNILLTEDDHNDWTMKLMTFLNK